MKLERTLAAAALLLALAGCGSEEDPLQPPVVPPTAHSWEPVHAGLTLTGVCGSSC
jgi:predicted small lipoprotein YifL